MGKSSSSNLRIRIVGEIERGQFCRSAARRYGVSPATAVRLAQRKVRQGRPPGSGTLSAHVDLRISWVETTDDITMPKLANRLLCEHGVKSHPASLPRLLLGAGFTVKKHYWRRKQIALMWCVLGGCGRQTVNLG